MLRRLRRHLTPPMAVAFLALFVALGGAGYAVSALPDGSVGTAQLQRGAVTTPKIAKDAVTSAKIKDGTVASADLSAGLLRRLRVVGTTGAAGPQGPAGPAGSSGAAGATWASAGAFLSPDHSASCAGTCLALFSQGFTTPAAGRLLVQTGVTFQYTCSASDPGPSCSPVVGIYVDGVPLRGSGGLAGVAARGSGSGERTVTNAGVTQASVPAGAHTLEIRAVMNPGQQATLDEVANQSFSVLLVGG